MDDFSCSVATSSGPSKSILLQGRRATSPSPLKRSSVAFGASPMEPFGLQNEAWQALLSLSLEARVLSGPFFMPQDLRLKGLTLLLMFL